MLNKISKKPVGWVHVRIRDRGYKCALFFHYCIEIRDVYAIFKTSREVGSVEGKANLNMSLMAISQGSESSNRLPVLFYITILESNRHVEMLSKKYNTCL